MLRTLLATALACGLGAPALAQTATISGTVADESGAAVPGATVELIGPGSNCETGSCGSAVGAASRVCITSTFAGSGAAASGFDNLSASSR